VGAWQRLYHCCGTVAAFSTEWGNQMIINHAFIAAAMGFVVYVTWFY
jgi:hypothetical protein